MLSPWGEKSVTLRHALVFAGGYVAGVAGERGGTVRPALDSWSK